MLTNKSQGHARVSRFGHQVAILEPGYELPDAFTKQTMSTDKNDTNGLGFHSRP